MFTNSDFKMAFVLTVIGSTAATSLVLVNKSWNVLGNLSLKVKKVFDFNRWLRNIFKLQDINLSVHNVCGFFTIWIEVLPKNGNLTEASLLGTFSTLTLGEYNLLRNDLIHESMKLFFLRIVFKWLISKLIVLK